MPKYGQIGSKRSNSVKSTGSNSSRSIWQGQIKLNELTRDLFAWNAKQDIENMIFPDLERLVESALEAVSSGVEHVQIINGTIDHSVLLELFTDSGIGTMIRRL